MEPMLDETTTEAEPGLALPPELDPDAPDESMRGIAESANELLLDDPPILDPDSLLLQSDEEILKVASSRMTRACSFRASRETVWKNSWTDWMLFLRGNSKAWQSKVFIPLVLEQVSSGVPSFVAAIFDSGRLFDIVSLNGIAEERARAAQDMAEFFLRVRMNAEREIEDWVKYSLLLGTGVMKDSWLRVEGTRRDREEVKVPMPDGTVSSLGFRDKNVLGVVLENRPQIEAVDLWNWFPAPYFAAGGETPWAFERIESTVEDLLHDAKAGLFGLDGLQRVEEWLKTNPEQQGTQGVWQEANTRAEAWDATNLVSPFSSEGAGSEAADRKHAQIVYWVKSAKDYRIVISGDGTKVLGKGPNPYKHGEIPYTEFCFDRIPKSPFGRGVGEICADIQSQINFNYNKGNDAAQLALNKPLKLRGAGNAGVQTVWQPGVIVRLRDVTDLEPLDVKNPMAEVGAMNADLISHADKATGLNDLSRGSAQPGINTATESANIASQFRIRMNGHARGLKGAMSRLGRHIVHNLQQFIDTPTAISIVGEDGLEWKTVRPEDIAGDFHVVSTASFSKSNPSMKRQDMIAAAPIVLKSPVVNQYEFMKRFLEGFEFEHVERLLVKPPPPMRDPTLEQMALDMGIEVDPSPLEMTTGGVNAHLQTHLQALQAFQSDPMANPKGLAATQRHVEQTMMMGHVLQQQGAMAPGGPPSEDGEEEAKGPGGAPERKEATRLGQAQGSDGPPGRSPGPAAPGRRS